MIELPMINIHSKKEILVLDSGKYYINIIDGFLVKKNNFKIKIVGISTPKTRISILKTKFPVQSYDSGRRSKRCYEFNIKEKGKYQLEFENSKNLIVKRSNVAIFFPFNLFNRTILNEKIEIRIVQKSYW